MRSWLSTLDVARPRGPLGLGLGLAFLGVAAVASASPEREDARALHLFKPAHEDVRIEWSAAVHEEGGEFLLSRSTLQGSSLLVARMPSRPQDRYRVVEPSAAGAWVYQLRYRDSHGREQVLATIELNVEEIEPGRASVAPALHYVPAAVPLHLAAGLMAAPFAQAVAPADDAPPQALRARPPTPPPRG